MAESESEPESERISESISSDLDPPSEQESDSEPEAEPEPYPIQFDFPSKKKEPKIFIDELFKQMSFYTKEFTGGNAQFHLRLSSGKIAGEMQMTPDFFERRIKYPCKIARRYRPVTDLMEHRAHLLTRTRLEDPSESLLMIFRALKKESIYYKDIALDLMINHFDHLQPAIENRDDTITEFLVHPDYPKTWVEKVKLLKIFSLIGENCNSVGLGSSGTIKILLIIQSREADMAVDGLTAKVHGLTALLHFSAKKEWIVRPIIADVSYLFRDLVNFLRDERVCSLSMQVINNLCEHEGVTKNAMVQMKKSVHLNVSKKLVQNVINHLEIGIASLCLLVIARKKDRSVTSVIRIMVLPQLMTCLENAESLDIWRMCVLALKQLYPPSELNGIIHLISIGHRGNHLAREYSKQFVEDPEKFLDYLDEV